MFKHLLMLIIILSSFSSINALFVDNDNLNSTTFRILEFSLVEKETRYLRYDIYNYDDEQITLVFDTGMNYDREPKNCAFRDKFESDFILKYGDFSRPPYSVYLQHPGIVIPSKEYFWVDVKCEFNNTFIASNNSLEYDTDIIGTDKTYHEFRLPKKPLEYICRFKFCKLIPYKEYEILIKEAYPPPDLIFESKEFLHLTYKYGKMPTSYNIHYTIYTDYQSSKEPFYNFLTYTIFWGIMFVSLIKLIILLYKHKKNKKTVKIEPESEDKNKKKRKKRR